MSNKQVLIMTKSLEDLKFLSEQTNPFFLSIEYEGEKQNVAWVNVHKSIKNNFNTFLDCRECIKRAKNMTNHGGVDGPMLFGRDNLSEEYLIKLKEISQKTCSDKTGVVPMLINSETYPGVVYTDKNGKRSNEVFSHFTIFPSKVTSEKAYQRLFPLWNFLIHSTDERLKKFLTYDSRQSMPIILSCIENCERPEIYLSSAKWLINIQNEFPKNYEIMTDTEKMNVKIFAMITGRAEGSKHYDFYTSSNFISMLTMNSREQVMASLNERSSDENYQRSALIRELDRHSITSKCTVSLVWDGEIYKDDLDLEVATPKGYICSWRNKKVGGYTLDFDAGIHGEEINPVENISCVEGETISIRVNNYRRRTFNENIRATVFIREAGLDDIVLPIVWPCYRLKDDFLIVKTHTFCNSLSEEPKMSSKLASSIISKDKSYQEIIGDTRSSLPTIHEIECQKKVIISSSIHHGIMEMALESKKIPLHKKCFNFPTNISELLDFLNKGTHNLSIHIPDFSPGYIVNVETASEKALKGGKKTTSIPCHYKEKFKLPVKPSKNGNARLDSEWFTTNSYTSYKAKVNAILKINDVYFFALKDTKLPRSSVFPIGGGYYPTDLTSIAYTHRTRWTYNHSTIMPMIKSHNNLAIGTFILEENISVYLDGKKINLHIN